MANIKTSGGRADLPIDADAIVWTKHAIGQYVGFRKTAEQGGTWWARLRDPSTGKQHYKALGEFADFTQAKRYDAALKAALEWFRSADAGVTPHNLTVRHACERHVNALRAADGAGKADETEKRFMRLVYGDPLASIELGRLKKGNVEEWRNRVAMLPAKVSRHKKAKKEIVTRDRAPSTLNRDMVGLRAALNRALEDGLVASDVAWRVALKPIKNADRRRGLYLERKERACLLESANDEIRPFLRALTLLPLRPGALAALTVADFNPKTMTLRVGTDKTSAARWIKVPPATADFLAEQAKGKLPAAPLVGTAGGRCWSKDSWKRPIRDAVAAAKLPAATTAYTLRHSVITDLVTGGLDLLTIAQISGTSVAMIEQHYGHLRKDHAAKALAALAL